MVQFALIENATPRQETDSAADTALQFIVAFELGSVPARFGLIYFRVEVYVFSVDHSETCLRALIIMTMAKESPHMGLMTSPAYFRKEVSDSEKKIGNAKGEMER